MKLNEKSLARYAGSGAPPDKEGYLHKRGELNKGYQKRWCVLKGNLLFYYEKRTEKDPIGVIVLEGCTIELSDHSDGFTFMINFPGSACRTYVLSADNQEEMESWMKVLSCASYDYMKMCVNELQHLLAEMDIEPDKKLAKQVLNDSREISEVRARSQNTSKVMERFNPFDTEESADHDSFEKRESVIHEKQARTFSEMYKDFDEQISEIVKEWLKDQNGIDPLGATGTVNCLNKI